MVILSQKIWTQVKKHAWTCICFRITLPTLARDGDGNLRLVVVVHFFLLDPMCAQSALLESWLCIGTLTSSSVRIAPNILTTHLVMLLLFNTSAAWRSGYSRACGVYIFLVKCTRIWDESKDLIFRLGYESGCVLINSAPGSVRTFCLQWNHFARAKCHSSVITKLKLGRVTWVTH
jgi:hypothetical protein